MANLQILQNRKLLRIDNPERVLAKECCCECVGECNDTLTFPFIEQYWPSQLPQTYAQWYAELIARLQNCCTVKECNVLDGTELVEDGFEEVVDGEGCDNESSSSESSGQCYSNNCYCTYNFDVVYDCLLDTILCITNVDVICEGSNNSKVCLEDPYYTNCQMVDCDYCDNNSSSSSSSSIDTSSSSSESAGECGEQLTCTNCVSNDCGWVQGSYLWSEEPCGWTYDTDIGLCVDVSNPFVSIRIYGTDAEYCGFRWFPFGPAGQAYRVFYYRDPNNINRVYAVIFKGISGYETSGCTAWNSTTHYPAEDCNGECESSSSSSSLDSSSSSSQGFTGCVKLTVNSLMLDIRCNSPK